MLAKHVWDQCVVFSRHYGWDLALCTITVAVRSQKRATRAQWRTMTMTAMCGISHPVVCVCVCGLVVVCGWFAAGSYPQVECGQVRDPSGTGTLLRRWCAVCRRLNDSRRMLCSVRPPHSRSRCDRNMRSPGRATHTTAYRHEPLSDAQMDELLRLTIARTNRKPSCNLWCMMAVGCRAPCEFDQTNWYDVYGCGGGGGGVQI